MDGIIWWVVGIIFVFILIGCFVGVVEMLNIDFKDFDDDEPY